MVRFFSRSPGFKPPSTTSEHSSFRVAVDAERALDLTKSPFDAEEARWCDPDDYTACQSLATEARTAKTQLLRTISVRHPAGFNIVIFDPSAFAERAPHHGKTWHLRYENERLVALAAAPHEDRHEFTKAHFGLV